MLQLPTGNRVRENELLAQTSPLATGNGLRYKTGGFHAQGEAP